MVRRHPLLRKFVRNFPGYRRFGFVAFLPIFFAGGAGLEFLMIKWTVGETNFYKTYKRNQSRLEAERRLALLLSGQESPLRVQ